MRFRWSQLVLGVVCMAMIANLQYGWTLFVNPIDDKYHWGRAAIQVAFTIFVSPKPGSFRSKAISSTDSARGRWCSCGGLLCGIAWVINSYAASLPCSISRRRSAASARARCTARASATRSSGFPIGADSRPGITAAGFGAGSALTVVPIAHMIKARATSRRSSISASGRACIVFYLSLAAVAPPAELLSGRSRPRSSSARREYAPMEVLRTPVFWVMYLMFVLVGGRRPRWRPRSSAPIAKDFGIARHPCRSSG